MSRPRNRGGSRCRLLPSALLRKGSGVCYNHNSSSAASLPGAPSSIHSGDTYTLWRYPAHRYEDKDGDGTYELLHEDVDGDGVMDLVHEDSNGDGIYDTVHEDLDGDGEVSLLEHS
mgnify:CR=1 FL=1